jgi:hypothetical protein
VYVYKKVRRASEAVNERLKKRLYATNPGRMLWAAADGRRCGETRKWGKRRDERESMLGGLGPINAFNEA